MSRRTYGEACCLAQALDVVGERWTLLLVRELMLGPRRYGELLDGLPGIGTNLLAERLRTLEAAGVIDRPGRGPYHLTELGHSLQDVVFALARFGLRVMPDPAEGDALRSQYVLLALRAMADPLRAPEKPECYEFTLGTELLHVTAGPDGVDVLPGPAAEPDLRLRSAPLTFLRIGSGNLDPVQAVMSGQVAAEGNLEALGRLVFLLGLVQPTAP